MKHARHILTAWQLLSKNWIISMVNKFVIIAIILSVVILIWRFKSLPPQVPLWYQRPWGEDQLASPYFLILLPVGSGIIYLANGIISIYHMKDHLVFTQILFLTSLVVTLLSFITLVKILFLVS